MLKIIKFFSLLSLAILLIATILQVRSLQFQKFDSTEIEQKINNYYSRSYAFPHNIEGKISDVTKDSIVILGESSVILPGNCESLISDENTFPNLLKRNLKTNVVNLGFCGADTVDGVKTLQQLIEKNKLPKSIVIYFGHNDVTNIFRNIYLSPRLFIPLDFYRNYLSFIPANFLFKMVYGFFHIVENPRIRIMRKFNPTYFRKADGELIFSNIEKHYLQNINEMIKLSKEHQVNIYLITPVGNLFYPPMGADDLLIANFKANKEKDDREALLKISDEDYFGFDQRVKSQTVLDLMQLKNEVIVVNVSDKINREPNKEIYKSYFTDIFHLGPSAHKIIFDELKKSLK